MSNLLGANGDVSFYITLGVIVAIFVVMITLQSKKRKTAQTEYNTMVESLRVGTRVKTVGGVIGKILEIREEAPGFKTVLLETGGNKGASIILYDIQAIYGVVDDAAIAEHKLGEAQKTNVSKENGGNNGVESAKNAFETEKPKRKSTK